MHGIELEATSIYEEYGVCLIITGQVTQIHVVCLFLCQNYSEYICLYAFS